MEEHIFTLEVDCGPWMVIGDTGEGSLRVIPIVGGTFSGKINGTIIPGGADWNTQEDPYISHAFAKYVIQTEDGTYISVENEGTIDDRKPAPFITHPKFQVAKDSEYSWLAEGEYIGKLTCHEGGMVSIAIYSI